MVSVFFAITHYYQDTSLVEDHDHILEAFRDVPSRQLLGCFRRLQYFCSWSEALDTLQPIHVTPQCDLLASFAEHRVMWQDHKTYEIASLLFIYLSLLPKDKFGRTLFSAPGT